MKKLKTAFEVEALTQKAENSIAALREGLVDLWGKGTVPKNFLNDLEKLMSSIESIKSLGEDGLINLEELKQANSDTNGYSKTLRHLYTNLKLLNEEQKKALLDDKIRKSFEDRSAAVNKYEKALKKASENAEKLNELESKKSVATEKLKALSKPVETDEIKKLKEYKALQKNLSDAEAQAVQYRIKGRAEGPGAKNELARNLQYQEELKQGISNIGLSEDQILNADKILGEYETSLEKVEIEANDLKKTIEKLQTQITQLSEESSAPNIEELKESLKKLGVTGLDSAQDLETIKTALQKMEKEGLVGVDEKIKVLINSLSEMGKENEEIKDQVSGSTAELQRQQEVLNEKQAFENKIKQFLGLTGAVELLRRAVGAAMQTISELDKTMTEMSVVTNLDIGDYWDRLPEYTKRANELGISINAVYKADTLFYQQGLKTKEVVELSTEAMKMARIAGIDTAEATNKMTAALRGFNMELSKVSAQRISDVYSQLAAITAADTNEIANAMTKTASIASSAGMEFETTAAFLSQIIETTRESAATAGTAMKTIVARFQELKKSPNEIGEIEGEIIDANQIEKALRSVGVSLRDASGQFRELDEVFLELSAKWDSLDKNTQRYIATIAAGSRQQSRFIAMMSDYKRTQELVEAANNSAGASNEQFEKTLDSLESKVANLKNAWHEFTMGILNSDLVKLGVDILTKFLEIINKATSAFDGLGGSISKIASVLVIFEMGKKIFEKLKAPLVDFFADIVRRAGIAGEEAARAAVAGVNKVKNTQPPAKPTTPTDPNKKFSFSHFVGYDKFRANNNLQKAAMLRDRGDVLLKKGTKLEEKLKKTAPGTAQYEKINKQYNKTLKEIDTNSEKTADAVKKLTAEQKKMLQEGKAGYAELGQQMVNMGQAATTAGVGISMLGGLLSSLSPNLEGVGETISKIGSYLMMAGTMASAFGSIADKLSNKLVEGGLKAQAAWWWAVAIVAAVTFLVIAVISIAKAVQEASPEKKLERARKAADDAKEAASKLSQEYENLKDSLDSLDESQKTLKSLTKGTKAWKEGVAKLNKEILDLINAYPQLAKFVQYNDGVMSIDIDDDEVQRVLKEYEQTAARAQVMATASNIHVLQAQQNVAYANLDEKVGEDIYRDPDEEYALTEQSYRWSAAGIGAMEGGRLGAKVPGVKLKLISTAVGTALGGVIGYFSSGPVAEAAAEEAKKQALEHNAKIRPSVEKISKALSDGVLLDTGAGYKLAENITDQQFKDRYEIDVSELDSLYDALGDSTEALREFGDATKKLNEQISAYYASMATQIYNALDKSTWSDEAVRIGDNLIDETELEKRVNSIKDDLSETTFTGKGDLDEGTELRQRVENAIAHSYGTGAKVKEEDGKFNIVNEKGDVLLDDVRDEQFRDIVATAEAEQSLIDVGEQIPLIADQLILAFQQTSGDITRESVIAAFDDEMGTTLTLENLKELGSISEATLQKMYKNNSDLQKVFSTETHFLDTYLKSVSHATTAFSDATTFLEGTSLYNSLDKITSEALLGLIGDNKLGLLYESGTTQEITDFERSFANVLSQGDQQAIVERMNAIGDWTNQEHLLDFQYDLIKEYGIQEAAAKDLVSSMILATNAVSGLALELDTYGKLYKATQQVNTAIKELTKLQWEYKRSLEKGDSDLSQNIANQISLYSSAFEGMALKPTAISERIGKLFAQARDKNGQDYTEFFRAGASGIEQIDPDMDLDKYLARLGGKNTEAGKAFVEWKDSVQAEYDSLDEVANSMQDLVDDIDTLISQLEESYQEVYEAVRDGFSHSMQSLVDEEKASAEATKNSVDSLVSSVNEAIEQQRQDRQNAETEKVISDSISRLAYLRADSAGGNDLLIAELQKSIEDQQTVYTDTLIDQTLQQITEDNEKAYLQREQQISIAQQQLEAYLLSQEFEEKVAYATEDIIQYGPGSTYWENTIVGNVESLNAKEAQLWQDNFAKQVQEGGLFKQYGDSLTMMADSIANSRSGGVAADVETIAETLAMSARTSSVGQATDKGLKTAVFNTGDYETDTERATTAMSFVSEVGSNAGIGYKDDEDDRIEWFNEYGSSILSALENSPDWEEKTREERESSYKEALNSSYTEHTTKKIASNTVDSLIKSVSSSVVSDGRMISDADLSQFKKAKEEGGLSITEDEFKSKVYNKARERMWLKNLASMRDDDPGRIYNGDGARYTIADFDEEKLGGVDSWLNEVVFVERVGAGKTLNKILGINKASEVDDQYYWYKNQVYWSHKNSWWATYHDGTDDQNEHQEYFLEGIKKKYGVYKTGGLADFTGPAWLDGTKTKPEYVLNADQTERFFSLVDVLEGLDANEKPSQSTQEVTVDIDINVEKISSDYDVEQMANKIRKILYEDSMYRNVNNINLIH